MKRENISGDRRVEVAKKTERKQGGNRRVEREGRKGQDAVLSSGEEEGFSRRKARKRRLEKGAKPTVFFVAGIFALCALCQDLSSHFFTLSKTPLFHLARCETLSRLPRSGASFILSRPSPLRTKSLLLLSPPPPPPHR